MPSYMQRGRRLCTNCNNRTTNLICENCGGKTVEGGQWSVRFRISENGEPKNKRLSGFATRDDAEIAYKNYLSLHGNGIKSFKKLYEEYLNSVAYSLKGSTLYNKMRVFELHILPFFDKRDAFRVNKRELIEWRTWLMKKRSKKSQNALSVSYINNIRAELCAFFSYLNQVYDIPNIVLSMKPLKKNWEQVKEMRFYDLKQFKRLITRMKRAKSPRIKNMWVTFFMMLYYSGARVGEVLALSDTDIDFSSGMVYINKSLTRKTLDGSPYKITTPKNKGSIRNISLPKHLLHQLSEYLEWKKQMEISGYFLFGGEKPLGSFSYSRMLKNYSIIAGLPCIRIHDFRHSHASLLINLGANVALVSRRLGHINTQQTLNTYSHLFPNYDKEIMKLLDKCETHKYTKNNFVSI